MSLPFAAPATRADRTGTTGLGTGEGGRPRVTLPEILLTESPCTATITPSSPGSACTA